jgi:hypothetical protein
MSDASEDVDRLSQGRTNLDHAFQRLQQNDGPIERRVSDSLNHPTTPPDRYVSPHVLHTYQLGTPAPDSPAPLDSQHKLDGDLDGAGDQ